MAWAYNILEEGLGKVDLVKLIEDNSILSPEVDIIKLDVPIEVGEGFSVELTNSGPWISRSIRLPVGGSTLASPRDFLDSDFLFSAVAALAMGSQVAGDSTSVTSGGSR